MGRTYDSIDERLAAFIEAQPLFFVATAPLAADGHVNCSPKGLDTFRVLDPHTVAYLDLTGSGVETVAHLRENARIVLCFCAFQGPPKILRLHGRGEVLEPGDPGWPALRARFPEVPLEAAVRSVVRVRVERVADSCGYGVPVLRPEGERPQLHEWARRKGDAGLSAYREQRNRASLDGLPGLRPRRSA
jgi:hypothetical protein